MKILQITAAAPGWFAAFKLPDETRVEQPIPLWAIVEHDDGTQAVQALTPIHECLDLLPHMWPGKTDNFTRYIYKEPE